MKNLIKNPFKNPIQQLSDHTLLDEVRMLVCKEKELVAQVIDYLKEIEVRKLHLARGYSSLFAFATEFLGYSEAEAHIRIQAARLSQALPEVKTFIESGDISLSVAATAQKHFRKENQRRKEAGQPSLSLSEKREVLELVMGSSRRDAEQSLNIHFAQQGKKVVSFEASPELAEKIERLMDLMAHKNYERDLAKMVELLVDGELARYDKQLATDKVQMANKAPKTFKPDKTEKADMMDSPDRLNKADKSKDGRKIDQSFLKQFGKSDSAKELRLPGFPEVGVQSPPKKVNPRYIPRQTRALVWAKSKGQCTYKDPLTGRKCQATHGLEVDHRLALSKGGDPTHENLTLLCRSHNQWKAARLVE